MATRSAGSPAGDVFSTVDGTEPPARPGPRPNIKHASARSCVQAALERLNSADIPFSKVWQFPKIDFESISLADAPAIIRNRVESLAAQNIDVVWEKFFIDEDSTRRHAANLTDSFYEAGRGRELGEHSYWLLDPVFRFIGIPSVETADFQTWFYRKLLKHNRQVADYVAHCMGDVGKFNNSVISEAVLASRQRQLIAQDKFAATHCMTNVDQDGNKVSVPFADAASNASKRAAKAYVRVKGLDDYCQSLGLTGYFVTLTLPSRFHPNPAQGRNQWDGSTPLDGHTEMQRRWRSFQKRFGERGGKCLGARVEEPHEDGCPHWHALIYVCAKRESFFRQVIEDQFGSGLAARIDVIDRKISTGASYLMKYILPATVNRDNLDPATEGPERNKVSKAPRYDAHRATWGGRSVQFFDVPGSSTIWDEMRRIKDTCPEYRLLSEVGQKLHRAAVDNKYCDFLLLLIEMNQPLKEARVQILYGLRENGRKFLEGIEVDRVRVLTHRGGWVVTPTRMS